MFQQTQVKDIMYPGNQPEPEEVINKAVRAIAIHSSNYLHEAKETLIRQRQELELRKKFKAVSDAASIVLSLVFIVILILIYIRYRKQQ